MMTDAIALSPRQECKACDGTGLIAPSPFVGDDVPWHVHLETCEAILAGLGCPRTSSATFSGLVKPIPCTKCEGLPLKPRVDDATTVYTAESTGERWNLT